MTLFQPPIIAALPYQECSVFLELLTGKKEEALPEVVFEQDKALLLTWDITENTASGSNGRA